MINNLKLGQLGEEIAKDYLQKKGFEILEHNYKNKYGEIDLVCKDRNSIVFVEVKTRIGELFGGPEGSLNKKKVRRLIRNAQAYMIRCVGAGLSRPQRAREPRPSRIDAVCVVLDQDKKIKRIDHYQNITG